MKSLKVPNLSNPTGFSQITRSDSNPHIFYISGQPPIDENGHTVGLGNLEAQVIQSFQNLDLCLKVIGATFTDVMKLTIFVVPMDKFDVVRRVRERFLDRNNLPAITSIGVTSLVDRDWLVELEAVVEAKN
jgi:2-iminobutanoate/2-iminopropanoate deaminase